MAAEYDDPNLLRILISTDNHLGVWEKDETRRDDSFRAFEEVLQLAVEKRADMVLLGGDLFHENKPSRSTLVKAIQLLSKYCLNDRPVRFRILSDQSVNFVSGRVNFENPNLNIGLPVFTIHGNHDDPSGQDSLSAVDILSQTGLLNYFGKHPLTGSGAARITLSPVLLEKGATRLCMYGLGNIRDERLGRSFQTPGCVQWQRPASTPVYPSESWINMFVLHQNRVQHTAFAKACVREEHLPPFLDLAVWGHEHECRPDPVAIRGEGEGRYVVQPGSTVATALSEGESRPKHALLLEIKGTNFRLQKFRLRSVRPFEFETVSLKDVQPALLPEDQEAVTSYLTNKINEMITRAAASQLPLPSLDGDPAGAAGAGTLLPLIRLRVDYTGFSTVNAQRLGQRFVGKVANPHDMLQWTKAVARKAKAEGGGEGTASALYEEGGYLRPDALDQTRIEDLIRQYLGPTALEVLPDDELGIALHNFVEKDDKNALQQCIEAALEETRMAAMAAQQVGPEGSAGEAVVKTGEEELLGVVRAGAERRRQQRKEQQLHAGDEDGVDMSALTAGVTTAGGTVAYGGGAGAYGGDEVMADASPPVAAARAGPSQPAATGLGRGHGRSRGGRQQSLADSLSRGRGRGSSQGGPLDAFLQPSAGGTGSTQQQATPARARGTRTTAAAAGGAKGRGGRGRGAAKAAATPAEDNDVEMADVRPGRRGTGGEEDDRIEDLEDEEDEQAAPAAGRRGKAAASRATATPAERGRSTRGAAVGRKSYRVDDSDEEDAVSSGEEDVEEEDDDEDDEDSPPPTIGRGRGKGAAAGTRAAAGAGRSGAGRGRGRAAAGSGAAAGKKKNDVISLTSDDEDDEPGPSLGPPAARAHAAAGAAFVATAGGPGTTGTITGVTPSGTTPAAGAAAPGGRKRPPSFFSSGATQGGRGGAGAAGRGWGQAR